MISVRNNSSSCDAINSTEINQDQLPILWERGCKTLLHCSRNCLHISNLSVVTKFIFFSLKGCQWHIIMKPYQINSVIGFIIIVLLALGFIT